MGGGGSRGRGGGEGWWRDSTITPPTTAWMHQTGNYREQTDWTTCCPTNTENKEVIFTFSAAKQNPKFLSRFWGSVRGVGRLGKHLVRKPFKPKTKSSTKRVTWMWRQEDRPREQGRVSSNGKHLVQHLDVSSWQVNAHCALQHLHISGFVSGHIKSRNLRFCCAFFFFFVFTSNLLLPWVSSYPHLVD